MPFPSGSRTSSSAAFLGWPCEQRQCCGIILGHVGRYAGMKVVLGLGRHLADIGIAGAWHERMEARRQWLRCGLRGSRCNHGRQGKTRQRQPQGGRHQAGHSLRSVTGPRSTQLPLLLRDGSPPRCGPARLSGHISTRCPTCPCRSHEASTACGGPQVQCP